MIDYSKQRQIKHIGLVKKYADKLKDSELRQFDCIAENILASHDKSKSMEPEFTPYVYINWKYKCLAEGVEFICNDKMEERMNEATFHHVKNNSHHPEYWDIFLTKNPINSKDRDKPSDIVVDGTLMENQFVVEMVCDWCAVSEERGTNPFDWAKSNINNRWKFNSHQEELIYNVLNALWGENE
jgi:hypothetical protein